MIKLDHNGRHVAFAIIFLTPDQAIMQRSAELEIDSGEDIKDGERVDIVRPFIQLQLLDEKMDIVDSALLQPNELSRLLVSGRALGKQAEAIAKLVDADFERYRQKVKENIRGG